MVEVPILTYHSNNVLGNAYHNNDHVALAADLKLIEKLGLQVISLDQLMQWHQGQAVDVNVEHAVVLTCDDGSWFDYHDIEHPHFGLQRSFFNILKDHQQATGSKVHISSFVIVSPEGREELDKTCLAGLGWWKDDWWQKAQASGVMAIENHSWDHNHVTFHRDFSREKSFREVNDAPSCDHQLQQSQEYLNQTLNLKSRYFAYPYGNFSDYLKTQYLPQNAEKIGLKAAFTTEPSHVSKDSDIWAIPRYVCGEHWQKIDQLEGILKSS
ncbi:polysaccharide deacetylase family protein [Marinicella rhabdoformis]|uniref:polysaccharide deacetylase family protein n=1 Tax=Marinicella rhabdoformis TaxID=2580566 RepID=UPI0012AED4B0|nr:polysaccharide deacetylase family protein [Marinicella rhabdoformis]